MSSIFSASTCGESAQLFDMPIGCRGRCDVRARRDRRAADRGGPAPAHRARSSHVLSVRTVAYRDLVRYNHGVVDHGANQTSWGSITPMRGRLQISVLGELTVA